jgi:subtilisin family serine protease
MSHSGNSVIVGFHGRGPMTMEYADNALKQIDGFITIIHLYKYINAGLVQVDPGLIGKFMSDALSLDIVEYCNNNFAISLCSFNDIIERHYAESSLATKKVKSFHKLSTTDNAGSGIKIAMVDSGLQPHPYLPSTSFTEARVFSEFWPEPFTSLNKLKNLPDVIASHKDHLARLDHVRRTQQSLLQQFEWEKMQTETREVTQKLLRVEFLNSLISGVDMLAELESMKAPLSPNATETDKDEYKIAIAQVKEAVFEKGWLSWANDADDWHTFRTISSLVPDVPNFRGFLGQLRILSNASWDFVNNRLNVGDTVGHGTQMAGLLVGQPKPIGPPELTYATCVDVMGLVPNAELMVLKCYDSEKLDQSNLDAVIRALEHALENDADVVYVGVSFGQQIQPKAALALARTIQALAANEIPVVCPAGNNGTAGLDFPAAMSEAVAVTAIRLGRAKPNFSKRSNWAGAGEKVDFAAFGGDEDEFIISTDLNYGFAKISGTSVAAAISAGLIAKALSDNYNKRLIERYRKYMNDAIDVHTPFKPSSRMHKTARVHSGKATSKWLIPMKQIEYSRPSLKYVLDEAGKAASTHSMAKTNAPDRIGRGIIKEFVL